MRHLSRALAAGLASISFLASGAAAGELGSQQVAPYYGSFSHAIPIEVPGFRGLEPQLALAYSSESRNGFVGVGWNLAGFSQIERVNAGRGSTAFAADDRYLLDGQEMFACPGGSQSPSCTSGGTHAFKIETYLKVAFDSGSNTWTVWARNGTRFVYSPILQATGGTLRWGRTSATDTKNNVVAYTWACVEGDCYPSTAAYNGYLISIYRELRPDILSFAAYDAANRTKYRLRSIIQTVFGNTIRAHKLTYTTSPLTGRSLLASVQQYGKDAVFDGNGLITGGSALPAMSFTYRDDPLGRSFVSQAAAPPTPTGTVEPVRWAGMVDTYAHGDGDSLYKQGGGSNSWNAGAVSTRSIVSGDGFMEFTAQPASPEKAVMAGLSNGNVDASYEDIDFAIFEHDGEAFVYEGGIQKAGPFTIAQGDRLRVEVQGGVVHYKQNLGLLYTSLVTPTFPLLVDTSLLILANVIHDVVISGALQDSSHWCSSGQLLTADANSDGKTDQLCHRTFAGQTITGGSIDVAMATSNGFATPQTWYSGDAFNSLMIGDVNGDNKVDLIDYVPWDGAFLVLLNTGATFTPPVLWGTASAAPYGACRTAIGPTTIGTGDYNGDGVTDVSCKLYTNQAVFIGLSNGLNGFSFSVFGQPSCETLERSGTLDFNGDGKDDWYCIGMTNHTMWVFPSNGTAFDSWSSNLNGTFCNEPGYTLGDVNGDGRTDVVCKDNGKVALSSGRHFVVEPAAFGGWCAAPGVLFAAEVDGDTPSELICDNPGAGATDIQVRQWDGAGLTAAETWKADWCSGRVMGGDFNGDAKTDLLCDSLAVPVAVAGSGGIVADLALNLTNGIGGSMQVAYGVGTSFPSTNVGKQVVTSLTTLDGRGGSSTSTYQYADGRMDARERRFLGFRSAWESLPCLPGEVFPNCPRIWRQFRQDLASAGQVEQMNVYTDAVYPSRVQQNAFTTSDVAGTLRSLVTAQTAMTFKDDTPGCPSWPCADGKRVYTTHAYDGYGNRTQTTHHGDQDASGDETTEQWLFYPNTTAYIVSAMARQRTFAGITTAGALIKDTAVRHDGAASETIAPSQGYATTVRNWLAEESRWLDRMFAYDSWGNLITQTDATSRSITRIYDSGHHLFPTSQSNNAGETETATWDPVCGLPATHTDANQQVTNFQPGDAFCRPTRYDSPLGGFEIRSYLGLGNPTLQRVRVETPSPSVGDGSGNHFQEEFFDGAGRVWRRAKKGPAAGQVIIEDTTYNARGSVANATAPYHGSGAAPYAPSETVYTTTFYSDALDRRTVTVFPDANQVSTQYGLFSETRWDEHMHTTIARFDVFGRKVTSERALSGQIHATQYGYDLLGRLTSMVDPLANTWTWTFDSLGRNISKYDPDAGSMTYTYDDAGRLTTQIDAKGQQTDFYYEAAGRPWIKNTLLPGGVPEETVTSTYSQPRAGYFNVGRVTSVSGPASTTLTVDHDAAGRVAKQVRTIDGTSYNSTRTYDAGGRLKILRYSLGVTAGPDTVSYTYDAAGRVKAVAGFVDAITYDAAGRPRFQTNSNQTITERSYSPQRGFLTGIVTTIATGGVQPPIQSLTYSPDAAGMLSSVTSPFDRETWTYGYDDGHRLTSAVSPTPPITQTFQYDAIDRMTYNSRFGTYSYPAVGGEVGRPHAPTFIPGRGAYSYDDNGNLVSGGGLTIDWNVSNQPTQITASSSTAIFSYAGPGERLKKVHNGTTSIYPFGDDFEITAGVETRYVSAPGLGVVGKFVGPETSATAYWLHADRLGSIQAITTSIGTEVLRRNYDPFGETTFDSSSHVESRGYIQQRQDETDLLFLHARYYDPAIGLFLSPDPLTPTNARVGENRYGYALGDPINGTDRTGLLVWNCLYSLRFGDGHWECTLEYDFGFGGSPDPRGGAKLPNDEGGGTPGCVGTPCAPPGTKPPSQAPTATPPCIGSPCLPLPSQPPVTTPPTGTQRQIEPGSELRNYHFATQPSGFVQTAARVTAGGIGAAVGRGYPAPTAGLIIGGAAALLIDVFEIDYSLLTGDWGVVYDPRPPDPPPPGGCFAPNAPYSCGAGTNN